MDAAQLAQIFADALAARGTQTVFGLPGGGNNLEVVGAVQRAGLTFVLTHSESAATIMAAVHADLTGRPSAAVVTRGPGAASAVNGAAQAMLDRQAIVVLTDCVAAQDRSRVTHQYLDQQAMYRPVVKGSAVLGAHQPERVVADALDLAGRHPRGPVHLDFDPGSTDAAGLTAAVDQSPATRPDADADAVAEARARLAAARRPVVLLGGGARDAVRQVRSVLAGSAAPVLMTYRAKGVLPDAWPSCAGLLTGATVESAVLAQADLILAIGLDTIELIPGPWPYPAPVVSISAWPDPSSYLTRTVDLVGDLAELLVQVGPVPAGDWAAGTGKALRQAGLAALVDQEEPTTGISAQQLVLGVRAAAPAGTIATVDAGAHMLAVLPLWVTEAPDELVVSSGLATMGFALPAAIAAALARPGRRVVCFVGDGGLGMVLAELETLVRLQLPVTVVVFNDSRLSLIAVKQSSDRHGGEGAVAYSHIEFDQTARSFGVPAHVVATLGDLDPAIAASLATPGPALVDARVDPACYPGVLDAIRGERHRVVA